MSGPTVMTGGRDSEPLLGPDFFRRPASLVAPDLLGCLVSTDSPAGTVAVRITEVESYGDRGVDPASHAFRGRTRRNSSMFGEPGRAYVYLSYGIHHCLNLVCGDAGAGEAVLLRGGTVAVGEDLASRRRFGAVGVLLASGPGRLGAALGVDLTWDAMPLSRDVAGGSGVRAISVRSGPAPESIGVGPRIGISRARDWPARFWIEDAATGTSRNLRSGGS